MKRIAWLLEADGTVQEVTAVRPLLWPGTVRVTLSDGTQTTTNPLNLLDPDDLDRRFDWRGSAK